MQKFIKRRAEPKKTQFLSFCAYLAAAKHNLAAARSREFRSISRRGDEEARRGELRDTESTQNFNILAAARGSLAAARSRTDQGYFRPSNPKFQV